MLFNLETRAKPFLKWAGGKSAVLTQLVPEFPITCINYIEPFVGGGALFFSLANAVPTVLNDSNAELIQLYKVVRDSPELLMETLSVFEEKYCEQFYYAVRDAQYDNPIAAAARTLFLNKTGFNGLYRRNAKGKFNVPFGHRKQCPSLFDANNLRECSRRLQNADLTSVDFEIILNDAGPGDFVYCDPPYEPVSLTSSFNAYMEGGFQKTDQLRLRDACARAAFRGATVAISNSSAEFIRDIYRNFETKPITAKRAINSKGDMRGDVQEVLVILKNSAPSSLSAQNIHKLSASLSTL